jgi:cob(I)alamin adenosyltransferase
MPRWASQSHPAEPDELAETLRQLQQELFTVGADLATPSGTKESRTVRVSDEHIRRLESEIDRHDETLEPLKNFILPGGTERAAALHLARTICRRAEREIIELAEQEKINERVIVYLNRFSDLLFVLARTANARAGENDIPWRPERGSTSLPGET